ncbi:hypothetical protein BST95_08340 [Halioglobus japonicus]|uniref:Glycosyltransferase family 2 protein n=1 Tax=Halioglobus japonicus TaxID=930805 RepID=A0AAP8MEA4_9GAMM|nr:glycosyltransferase family 2 protein [Halioglobus japonicus]AQA18237.1 hypothetical protein BST95_08340 [Halioglobus japonicus]PLW86246.1 glycosyltransferase family 2 protein [Halioglobus japonicus]GHD13739.1 hypothetical protein GCM10007052_16500 [Halioglobus japonicus]
MIVVDTGSSDDSRNIVQRLGAKVFDFAWCDDFSAARNYSLEQASGDWIVVLDADEMIDPANWLRLRELVTTTERDAFFLSEHNYTNQRFEGGFVPTKQQTPYTRGFKGYKVHAIARLFRNSPAIRYRGHVHEVIDTSLGEEQYEVVNIVIHHHGEESPQRPKEVRHRSYLRLMEQDLDSDPSGRLYGTAASIRMHYLKDYATAARYYESAIRLGWRPQDSREGWALCQYLAGDLEAAYDGYRALYDEKHVSVNLCINLANLAVKRNEKPFAADLLERAIGLGVVDVKTRISLEHNIRFLRDNT